MICGGQVALADTIHVVGRNIQGTDHGVKGVVDTLDDLAIAALKLPGVSARGEFAGDRRLGQHPGLGHQRTQGLHHLNEALAQQVLLGLGPHFHGHIARSDLLRQGSAIFDHIGHDAERIGESAQFIPGVQFDTYVDVAQRQFLGSGLHVAQRLTDGASDEQPHTKGKQDAHSDKDKDFRFGGGGGFLVQLSPASASRALMSIKLAEPCAGLGLRLAGFAIRQSQRLVVLSRQATVR